EVEPTALERELDAADADARTGALQAGALAQDRRRGAGARRGHERREREAEERGHGERLLPGNGAGGPPRAGGRTGAVGNLRKEAQPGRCSEKATPRGAGTTSRNRCRRSSCRRRTSVPARSAHQTADAAPPAAPATPPAPALPGGPIGLGGAGGVESPPWWAWPGA